ncbi:hypothetical protein SRHO_G00306800 [Serrasalmus rhombeus]
MMADDQQPGQHPQPGSGTGSLPSLAPAGLQGTEASALQLKIKNSICFEFAAVVVLLFYTGNTDLTFARLCSLRRGVFTPLPPELRQEQLKVSPTRTLTDTPDPHLASWHTRLCLPGNDGAFGTASRVLENLLEKWGRSASISLHSTLLPTRLRFSVPHLSEQ